MRQSTGLLEGLGIDSPASVLGPLLRSSMETALTAAGEEPRFIE